MWIFIVGHDARVGSAVTAPMIMIFGMRRHYGMLYILTEGILKILKISIDLEQKIGSANENSGNPRKIIILVDLTRMLTWISPIWENADVENPPKNKKSKISSLGRTLPKYEALTHSEHEIRSINVS